MRVSTYFVKSLLKIYQASIIADLYSCFVRQRVCVICDVNISSRSSRNFNALEQPLLSRLLPSSRDNKNSQCRKRISTFEAVNEKKASTVTHFSASKLATNFCGSCKAVMNAELVPSSVASARTHSSDVQFDHGFKVHRYAGNSAYLDQCFARRVDDYRNNRFEFGSMVSHASLAKVSHVAAVIASISLLPVSLTADFDSDISVNSVAPLSMFMSLFEQFQLKISIVTCHHMPARFYSNSLIFPGRNENASYCPRDIRGVLLRAQSYRQYSKARSTDSETQVFNVLNYEFSEP